MKTKYLFIVLFLVIFSASGLAEEINSSANLSDTIINETDIINTTEEEPSIDYSVISIVPNEFKLGDIQFNIQVENKGNVDLKNLIALVSGKGFSTYDIIPIDSLKQGEKSYIIVSGNVRESGNITLTIKINDKTFNRIIKVTDPDSATVVQNAEELKKAQEEAKKELETISTQFNDLANRYKILESDLDNKTDNNYDVSDIKLDDLKEFLRDTQASIIQKDVQKAKVNVVLAQNEYNDLRDKVDHAQIVKKSISSVLKENAVLISTIAGSIVAMFTLFELLKKKKESLYEKIKEVKLNKETRVIVERKRKPKQEKAKEVSEDKVEDKKE
jgi:hypothetical protein